MHQLLEAIGSEWADHKEGMWLEQHKTSQPSVSFLFSVASGFRKHFGATKQSEEREMQVLLGMLSHQLLLFCLLSAPLRNEGRLEQKRKTSHECWWQKCCLTQAWTQSTATELAPVSCLILWRYRRTLVLLYKPQLTLLILSHLLCEVSYCTPSTEKSQVLNINQKKKCNAVFPDLGK